MDVDDTKKYVLSTYSHSSIYECVLRVANNLHLDEITILNTLEYYHKDIRKYVEEYKNRIHHPSRHLQYLSGPSSLVFFTNIAGRRILLLGEAHHSRQLCDANILRKKGAYEIQKWLIDICENSNTCVDVLTETPYKHNIKLKECDSNKSLKDYNNPLYAVTCELEKLKKTRKLPEYMRYHNVDLRRYKDIVFPSMRLYELFVSNVAISSDKKYDEIKNYYKKNKVSILSYILSIDRSIYARSAYHYMLSSLLSMYGQELDKEMNSNLEEQYFSSIDKEMNKIDEDTIHNKRRFLYTLLDIYLPQNMFIAMMVVPMDLYLLLRLFVKFDENKIHRESNPKGCILSKIVKDAIVYTGSAHSRTYRVFLEKYFNASPSLVIGAGSKSQCLKLNDFDFFSYGD